MVKIIINHIIFEVMGGVTIIIIGYVVVKENSVRIQTVMYYMLFDLDVKVLLKYSEMMREHDSNACQKIYIILYIMILHTNN